MARFNSEELPLDEFDEPVDYNPLNVEETPFIDDLPETPDDPDDPGSLDRQEKIKSFYKYFEDNGYEVDKNATLERRAVFKMNTDKESAIKYNDKTIRLTQAKNPNLFLSPRTIASNYGIGGVPFVRYVLGIKDKPRIPPPVEAQVIILNENIPQEMENIPMQDFGDAIDRVDDIMDEIETELQNTGVGTGPEKKDIGVNTDDLILQKNIDDLKRERKFFNSISGRIKIIASNISGLNEEIARLKAERDRINSNREDEINEERLREINNEIEEMIKQRDFQQEHFNRDLLPGIKSQFARIRETLNTMLYYDRTFGERIRTLFREQGLTISFILTSIGLAITLIVDEITDKLKAATPRPKPTPEPTPEPTPTPSTKQWIKQMLQKIKS